MPLPSPVTSSMAAAPKKSRKNLYHHEKEQSPFSLRGVPSGNKSAGNVLLLNFQLHQPTLQLTNPSLNTQERAEYSAKQEEKVSIPFFPAVCVLDWVTMQLLPRIPQYENLFFHGNTNAQRTYYIPQLRVTRQNNHCTKEQQEKT